MTRYRYGATLRPFGQLNLRRLEACPYSSGTDPRFATHGTLAFHHPLTEFQCNQLDLTFLGEEQDPDCS
jgi:hypothetical protein